MLAHGGSRLRPATVALLPALLAAAAVTPSLAGAQVAEPESGEAAAYRRHRHDATEHYVVAASLLVAGTTGVLYGYFRYVSGDVVNPDGYTALLGSPALLGVGLLVLAIGAGLDGGAAAWRGAAARRHGLPPVDRPALARERRDIGHAITALYVSGLSMAVVGGLSIVGVYQLEVDSHRSYAGYLSFDRGLYAPTFLVAGLGALAFCVAIGLDVAAGAWAGGARASISVAPREDGVSLLCWGTLP